MGIFSWTCRNFSFCMAMENIWWLCGSMKNLVVVKFWWGIDLISGGALIVRILYSFFF